MIAISSNQADDADWMAVECYERLVMMEESRQWIVEDWGDLDGVQVAIALQIHEWWRYSYPANPFRASPAYAVDAYQLHELAHSVYSPQNLGIPEDVLPGGRYPEPSDWFKATFPNSPASKLWRQRHERE